MREGRSNPGPKTYSLIFSRILIIYFIVIRGKN